jgi:acyl-CoA synthetase (AMP-forming)/AMP-acid ligase II
VLPDPWAKPRSRYTAAEFDAMCLGPDRIGELVVSGAHVLADPGPGDGTPTFTVDGIPWRRTGDAGYLDGRGQLWLLGRCAARVSDDRGTLYPFAVECAAHQDPRVRRAALIGHRGRRLLVAEPRDRADAPGLVTLRGVLAWAQLDAVRVVPRLPVDRRHRSKIDYPALRQLLERA